MTLVEPASSGRAGLVEAVVVALALLLLLQGTADRIALVTGATPLNSDLPGYVDGAVHSRFFFDSGRREPLHVFGIKVALAVFDGAERPLRLLSVFETFLAALALWWAERRLVGRVGAALSLLLFVTNPVVLYYSAEGMRAPLLLATLALFTGLLLGPWPARRRLGWAVVVGLAGALVGLTRSVALGTVVGGVLVVAVQERVWRPDRRPRLFELVVVVGMALVLNVPAHVFRGDQILSDNLQYLLNLERTGEVGDWEGSPLGFYGYFFVEHSLWEWPGRLLQNLWLGLTDYLPFLFRGYGAAAALVAVGFPLAFVVGRGGLAAMAALSLLHVLPFFHIDQVGKGSGLEMRLVLHALPFAWWLAWLPLGLGLAQALRRQTDDERFAPWVAALLPPPAAGGARPQEAGDQAASSSVVEG